MSGLQRVYDLRRNGNITCCDVMLQHARDTDLQGGLGLQVVVIHLNNGLFCEEFGEKAGHCVAPVLIQQCHGRIVAMLKLEVNET
jgi:hypothetical protein